MKVPSKKNKNGYWYVRIHGKDFYLGRDPKAADKKYLDLLTSEWMPKKKSKTGKFTLSHVAAVYLEYIEGSVREATYIEVRRHLKKFINFFNDCAADMITPVKLSSFFEHLADKGLKLNTVKCYFFNVKSAMRYAQSRNMLAKGQFHDLETVSLPKRIQRGKSVSPPETEVLELVLQLLPGMYADFLRIEMYTGMRPCEICRMKVGDLKRISDKVVQYSVQQHKTRWRTGKPLEKFIGPRAFAVLEKYLHGKKSEDHVFQTAKGSPLTTQLVSRKVWGVCKKHDLHFFQYQLRHMAGTMVRKEADLESAQAYLGHSSIITSEIYAEVNFDKAIKIAEQFG